MHLKVVLTNEEIKFDPKHRFHRNFAGDFKKQNLPGVKQNAEKRYQLPLTGRENDFRATKVQENHPGKQGNDQGKVNSRPRYNCFHEIPQ